jgi:hypothetical protein
MREIMWNGIAPDEKRVFSGPSTAVRGNRTIYLQPTGLYKLFTFARFPGRIAPDESEALLARLAERTLATPSFGEWLTGLTVTQARRSPSDSALDSRPQTASNMDLLFIHHFDSEARARAAMIGAGYASIRDAEDAFLERDSRVTVLAHGWALKGPEAIGAGHIERPGRSPETTGTASESGSATRSPREERSSSRRRKSADPRPIDASSRLRRGLQKKPK